MAKDKIVKAAEDGAELEQILIATQEHFFSGPLPHPEILKHYETIYPGAARSIFKLVEDEQRHQQLLDMHKLRYSLAGSIFGFTLGLIGMVGSIWLLYNGKDLKGLTTFLATLGSLVGVYVYGRSTHKR